MWMKVLAQGKLRRIMCFAWLKPKHGRQRAEGVQPAGIVLAADTTVVDGKKLLGKPVRSTRGRTNADVSCVGAYIRFILPSQSICPSKSASSPTCASRQFQCGSYSDSEIEAYIESGDPFDKAGAYAIQNRSFRPVIKFLALLCSSDGFTALPPGAHAPQGRHSNCFGRSCCLSGKLAVRLPGFRSHIEGKRSQLKAIIRNHQPAEGVLKCFPWSHGLYKV